MTSAPKAVLNSTTEISNSADVFPTSHPCNDTSGNCDMFTANNSSSQGEENSTSTASDVRGRNYSNAVAFVTIGLTIWSILGNMLPLVAIIKQERLHKPVNILMANLAASDVLTGITFLTAIIIDIVTTSPSRSLSTTVARLLFTPSLLCGLSSAYSLLTLTAERYWFIVHGMTYVNQVTNDRCKVAIAVVWVWSGVLAMLPVFGWNCERFAPGCAWLGGGTPHSYLVLILVLVFIPMMAIVFFNVRVFYSLWQHVSDILKQEASVGAPPSTSRKSAVTIVLITGVFLVGWLPYCVAVLGCAASGDCAAVRPTLFFVILNSAVNPVIYGLRLREIRRGVRRLFTGNNRSADYRFDRGGHADWEDLAGETTAWSPGVNRPVRRGQAGGSPRKQWPGWPLTTAGRYRGYKSVRARAWAYVWISEVNKKIQAAAKRTIDKHTRTHGTIETARTHPRDASITAGGSLFGRPVLIHKNVCRVQYGSSETAGSEPVGDGGSLPNNVSVCQRRAPAFYRNSGWTPGNLLRSTAGGDLFFRLDYFQGLSRNAPESGRTDYIW
ncbi:G-protein coupled receptor 6 [Branchiostoma belcheri]|nr:G-protein coupled receptor 6 [Branchiostoma belcheri]